MNDDITLEQLLKALRDEPARSPLVEKTVQLLVVQLTCCKFDGKEVADALSKMTFALASGPDTMRNAMYALGAASCVSEDCKRAADAMTPKVNTSGSCSKKSSVIAWIIGLFVFILVFSGMLVAVWWHPLGHLSLWWKIPLSLVAVIVSSILAAITGVITDS